MLLRETSRLHPAAQDHEALMTLMTEEESPVSGAPQWTAPMNAFLLLLISPKGPQEPKKTARE